MSRFVLFTCMAFVSTFVGVSWAMRGFPVSHVSPVGELRPTLSSSFGDEHSKAKQRKDWEAEHTLQSDKDPKQDALRMDALQASTARDVAVRRHHEGEPEGSYGGLCAGLGEDLRMPKSENGHVLQ